VPVTSLPLPTSKSPEALAAYVAALQGTRDGNWGYVTSLLQRAVSLDPTLAIAHLRLAVYQYGSPLEDQGRASFGRALLGRDGFNERDQAMFSAFEPLYRDPPDRGEVVARLQALTDRYPNDAEFFSLLAFWSPDAHAALAAAQRCVELDPRSADGWQFMGGRLSELGDAAGALQALVSALGGRAVALFRAVPALNLLLGLELNRLEGTGAEGVSGRHSDAAWQVAPTFGASWIPWDVGYLRLEIGAAGRISAIRPRFVVTGFGDLYRVPVAGADAIIRGVWLFP
jgi:tetratricopeptide (TPR) repeat protein